MVIGMETSKTLCQQIFRLQSDEFFNKALDWLREKEKTGTNASTDCDPALQLARVALISRLFDSFFTSSTSASVESTEKVIVQGSHAQTKKHPEDGSSVLPATLTESSAAGTSSRTGSVLQHQQQRAKQSMIDKDITVSETIPSSSSIGTGTEEKKRAQDKDSSIECTELTEGNPLGGKYSSYGSRPDQRERKKNHDQNVSKNDSLIATRCFHGIANDLADFLGKHSDNNDVTDVTDIASQCYDLIKDEANWDILMEILNTVLIERKEEAPKCLPAANIKALFESVLHTIQQSTISSVECRTSFDYIWNESCKNDTFKSTIQTRFVDIHEGTRGKDEADKGNGKRTRDASQVSVAEDAEKRIKQMKDYAWLLYCVFSMKTGTSNLVVSSRKEKEYLLRIEACIGLMMVIVSPEMIPSRISTDQDEPALKKACLETEEGNDIIEACETQSSKSPTQGSSKESLGAKEAATNTGQRRLSIENEAIAALSMMVNGGSQESSTPDVREITPAERVSGDILHIIMQGGSALGEPISRSELEEYILHIGRSIAAPTPLVKDGHEMDSMALKAEVSASNFRGKLRSILPNISDRKQFTDVNWITQRYHNMLSDLTREIDCILNKEQEPDKLYRIVKGIPFVDEVRFSTTENTSMSRLHRRYGQAKIAEQKENETNSQSEVSSEPKAASELLSSLRAVNGTSDPMVTDAIDLNEWTVSILELSKIRPSTRLLLYLDASDDEGTKGNKKKRNYVEIPAENQSEGWRDVIIPVLNRALERMKETSNDASSDFMDVAAIAVNRDNGEMLCEGEVMCDEDEEARVSIVGKKICAAVVALYYQSLEKILFQETARLNSASHPSLTQSCSFHRGLLSCCYMCILKAVGASGKLLLSGPHRNLDLRSVLQVMECTPYTYLKVSESFIRSLNISQNGSSVKDTPVNSIPLPRLLQQHLQHCEVLIMDSLLWEHDGTFGTGGNIMEVVSELQRTGSDGRGDICLWPPDILQPNLMEEFEDAGYTDRSNRHLCQDDDPEHVYISYLLRKLLKIAYFRIASFCTALKIPPSYPITTQIWVAFRYLLRHNIDLLYDRHLDQLLLCTLYGVCKIMKYEPELTFSKIIEVYTKTRGREIGERECQRIVRHIKLHPDDDEDLDKPRKKTHGNVIHLYNHIFVPSLKNHLLQSKSLKKATSDLRSRISQGGTPEVTHDCSESITSMADRAVNVSRGWHGPTTIPVGKGNVTLNIPLPGMPLSSSFIRNSKIRARGADARTPRTRAFYSFGGAHAKDLELVNRMISQTGNNNLK